ncbi:MAG TPA: hypothetical protein VJ859_05315 [Allosphingosinicella sp.]|nr:hypothetical protein [Allosphingosinicella sp.]
MNDGRTSGMRAGGCLLATCILVGAFVGMLLRQSSIGFVAGTAIGLLLLAILWLRSLIRGHNT